MPITASAAFIAAALFYAAFSAQRYVAIDATPAATLSGQSADSPLSPARHIICHCCRAAAIDAAFRAACVTIAIPRFHCFHAAIYAVADAMP